MPAHPQHTIEDVREMVRFILSQRKTTETAQAVPLSGQVRLTEHIGKNTGGRYVLLATYADAGGGPITSLSAQEQWSLRAPRLEAEAYEEGSGNIARQNFKEIGTIGNLANNSFIAYKNLGLEGLSRIDIDLYFDGKTAVQGQVEVRLGGRDGKLIGSAGWQREAGKVTQQRLPIQLEPVSGRHDLYFIFKREAGAQAQSGHVDGMNLVF